MQAAERILGSRLWYRHALLVSGAAGRDDFIDKLKCVASANTGYVLDPRGPDAWHAGRYSVSKGTVHLVESQVARTQYVFAIAALLTPKAMSAPAAGRAVRELYEVQSDGRRLWMLPPTKASSGSNGAMVPYSWEDSTSLALRGDFPGLLAILALLRESVARSEFQRIGQHARDLYVALPSVSNIGWVRPDVDLLLQCVDEMMVGVRWIFARLIIDWDAFRAQMSKPSTWQGQPPWIVGASSIPADRRSLQFPSRPVPLLENVEPLWRWVHQPV